MKTSKILKTVVAIAAVAASGFASAAGVFTVNPTAADPTYVNLLGSFQSDYIAGNYQEVVTLTPATPLGGTFAYSIFWRGTEFDLGGVAVDTGLGDSSPVSTGLGVSYTLFATLYGSGTYTLSNAGPTPDVAFSPALGGTLNLFADFSGVGVTNPALGGNPFILSNIQNQRTLLTGTVTAASGQLNATGVGNNFGSFGVETTVSLVNPDGENFFSGPRPFFNASFEAGNFNGYWLQTIGNTPVTRTLGGGAQITFDNRIPEPSGIALAGMALIAAGFALRRRGRV